MPRSEGANNPNKMGTDERPVDRRLENYPGAQAQLEATLGPDPEFSTAHWGSDWSTSNSDASTKPSGSGSGLHAVPVAMSNVT